MAASTESRGYYRLAELMGSYQETAIFRRFGLLNMLNLLSLQAELVNLQRQLVNNSTNPKILAELDDEEKAFKVNFRKLLESQNSEHLQLLMRIRSTLREYNATLIQAAQLEKLAAPNEKDVEFLREWLDDTDLGGGFLEESEAFTWTLPGNQSKTAHKLFDKELVTTYSSVNEDDVFSRFLSGALVSLWNFFRSHETDAQGNTPHAAFDPSSGIKHYSERKLLRINNILISVISAAMPVAAIVALYFIKTEGGRIGAMAGFTIVFALVLAICTNARRLEIAASTAAFAAVEVVFIGSELGKE